MYFFCADESAWWMCTLCVRDKATKRVPDRHEMIQARGARLRCLLFFYASSALPSVAFPSLP